jgi:2,5-diketo-D-gluconate reductase A
MADSLQQTQNVPSIPLNDGHSIPQIGLGTWPLKDKEVAETIVTAVELGYRHIDTAYKYGNEKGVGQGIKRSGIAREELFVTTKLDGTYQGDDKALAGLEGSLDRMKLDYVDLLLIHWPQPKRGKFVSTFRTFKKLQDAGKVRSIGVSNFTPAHLDTLIDGTALTPAVNQIQIDPTIPRDAQRAYDTERGIVTSSWSPLGAGGDVLRNPVLAAIAEAHERTVAQVILRWHVQNGLVAVPKSSNPERIAANFAVFDFELSADDLTQIATLSLGPTAGVDSDSTGH